MPIYRACFNTINAERRAHVAHAFSTAEEVGGWALDLVGELGVKVTDSRSDNPDHPYDRFTAEDQIGMAREYLTWVTFEANCDETAAAAINLLRGIARRLDPDVDTGRTQRADRLRQVVVAAPLTLPYAGPREVSDLERKLLWNAYRRGAWEADTLCCDGKVSLSVRVPTTKAADAMAEALMAVYRLEGLPLQESDVEQVHHDTAAGLVRAMPVADLPLPPEDAARVLSHHLGLSDHQRVKSGTIRDWLREKRSPAGPLLADMELGGVNCLRTSTVALLASELRSKGWQPGRVGRPRKS
ncbi:MAG TPA: hypothetical protein VM347_41055 [Nonomuraea sp.]|nr:hypothetical protein [Nonomuraea sp.]